MHVTGSQKERADERILIDRIFDEETLFQQIANKVLILGRTLLSILRRPILSSRRVIFQGAAVEFAAVVSEWGVFDRKALDNVVRRRPQPLRQLARMYPYCFVR